MIFVNVEAVKSEGRGIAGGNCWVDTDDIVDAISFGLAKFQRLYDDLGHGAVVTYRITVAPEASPHRTKRRRRPLPVKSDARAWDG